MAWRVSEALKRRQYWNHQLFNALVVQDSELGYILDEIFVASLAPSAWLFHGNRLSTNAHLLIHVQIRNSEYSLAKILEDLISL